MGWYPLLNFVKNSYFLIDFYRNGNTIAVKSSQLGGNGDTFMPILSADTLDFAVAT